MGTTIQFLLVPDRAAARNVRRAVAESRPRLGLQVGTWGELLQAARSAFLLPELADVFAERLAAAAPLVEKAFWAQSHAVAPAETGAVLGRELERLLRALGPGRRLPAKPPQGLSPRAAAHLKDLAALHKAMQHALPADLATVQALLDGEPGQATRSVLVGHVERMPPLSPWQQALIDHLNNAVASERDAELATLLEKTLRPTPAAKTKTTLHALQTQLFQPDAKPVKRDASVQWVGCRDFLEEVEVCAGMIQQALREDPTLTPAGIGLLLPEDAAYAPAAEAVFAQAGLPVSGLVVTAGARDLGTELVRQFLLSLRKPAPVMALASLVTNPLLPWSPEDGRALADGLMERGFALQARADMRAPARALLAAINAGAEKPAPLHKALELLSGQLPETEALAAHSARAQEQIEGLLEALQGAKEIPWAELLSRVQPGHLPRSREGELSREGIAVMQEGAEPWRAVRRLFVLGFCEGQHPLGCSPHLLSELRLQLGKVAPTVVRQPDAALVASGVQGIHQPLGKLATSLVLLDVNYQTRGHGTRRRRSCKIPRELGELSRRCGRKGDGTRAWVADVVAERIQGALEYSHRLLQGLPRMTSARDICGWPGRRNVQVLRASLRKGSALEEVGAAVAVGPEDGAPICELEVDVPAF